MMFSERAVMLNIALYVYVHNLINIKFHLMPYLQFYLANFRFDWDESYLFNYEIHFIILILLGPA